MEMARDELREETGLDAANMTYVGHLLEACGYSNQDFHIFLATGLRRGYAHLEREEQDLVMREFTRSEMERMIPQRRSQGRYDGRRIRPVAPERLVVEVRVR
jgi:ADP-ribose pyrophosphatase